MYARDTVVAAIVASRGHLCDHAINARPFDRTGCPRNKSPRLRKFILWSFVLHGGGVGSGSRGACVLGQPVHFPRARGGACLENRVSLYYNSPVTLSHVPIYVYVNVGGHSTHARHESRWFCLSRAYSAHTKLCKIVQSPCDFWSPRREQRVETCSMIFAARDRTDTRNTKLMHSHATKCILRRVLRGDTYRQTHTHAHILTETNKLQYLSLICSVSIWWETLRR